MLFAKAYCIKNNYKYIGCPIHTKETKKLVKYLNLQNNYRKITPTQLNTKRLNPKKYRSADSKIFTPKIRNLIISNFNKYEYNNDFTITCHIRRGDVNPTKYPNRYLYNKYYIDLLNKIIIYLESICHITITINICSESKSYEAFDIFKKKIPKCNLYLDSKLNKVYNLGINADIFILSKSSFSFVPAFFNKNCVIYYPFWHKKLDHWIDYSANDFDIQLKNKIKTLISQKNINLISY